MCPGGGLILPQGKVLGLGMGFPGALVALEVEGLRMQVSRCLDVLRMFCGEYKPWLYVVPSHLLVGSPRGV